MSKQENPTPCIKCKNHNLPCVDERYFHGNTDKKCKSFNPPEYENNKFKVDCSNVIYLPLSALLEHAKTCTNKKCLAVRLVEAVEK